LEYTECPTRYQTRHFFNNSNNNEDIATKQTHTLQTLSSLFPTQRTYSCSDFVAISSLVLELLKNAGFGSEWVTLYLRCTDP